jgi:predicted dehydrogenase
LAVGTSTYSVAVIGSTGRGNYGHQLDKTFRGNGRARVLAVADDDEAAGRERAAELRAERSYGDWRAMLERERPDIVVVAPRHADRHSEMTIAAAQAGAHVYCEKPLARDLEEADRMVRAADEAGVKLACALPWRCEARAAIARDLIAQGAVGEVLAMSGACKCDARGGGEDFMILGLHFTDMMRDIAGDARECWAHARQEGRPIRAADAVEGGEGIGPIAGTYIRSSYAFDGGVTGSVVSTRAHIMERPLQPYRLMVHGTRAILSIRAPYADSSMWLYPEPVLRPDGPAWQRIEAPVVGEYAEYHVPAGEDLLAAIEDDRPPRCSGEDARAALEMVLAAYASALAGTSVPLPLADRAHPLA